MTERARKSEKGILELEEEKKKNPIALRKI